MCGDTIPFVMCLLKSGGGSSVRRKLEPSVGLLGDKTRSAILECLSGRHLPRVGVDGAGAIGPQDTSHQRMLALLYDGGKGLAMFPSASITTVNELSERMGCSDMLLGISPTESL